MSSAATRTAGTSRRRLLLDRAATMLVDSGGIAIIVSILGILVFILIEIWPLVLEARVNPSKEVPLPSRAEVRGVVGDEHRTHAATLTLDGRVRAVRLSDGETVAEQALVPEGEALVAGGSAPGSQLLTGSTSDGKVVLAPVSWVVSFREQTRVVSPRFSEPLSLEIDPGGGPIEVYAAKERDGTATVAAWLAEGSLAVVRRETRENVLTGERTVTVNRSTAEAPGPPTVLTLDEDQRDLYAGTARGELAWWRLQEGRPGDPVVVSAGPAGITALSLLLGDRALVVGQSDGSVSVWFEVPRPDGGTGLARVRDFGPHAAPIRHIAPSMRDKGFLVADASGGMSLYYSTSHRTLWTGRSPVSEPTAVYYSPKADGAYVVGSERIGVLDIHNRHPEISLGALFGKVWYEGSDRPEYVWQSTGGTDDFEPKLSLTPLLTGTLKGTFYSLILAIPLGVFGAMYASQFMHAGLKTVVKPMVEVMAGLPSVVLGFLAGLWLAPRLESAFPALVLMCAFFPALVLVAGFVWNALPRTLRNRLPAGAEVALYLFAVIAAIWLCIAVSRPFEAVLFGGDFPAWLLEATGWRYDQRNAIVVGLAMGFAVIPIIFAISEDAFSNVPRHLVSGSLALGATRWQTVSRVVLPTASPGIFSAIMVGVGRAVGETMIVLMATGNTPILDWSPFNGFRTLSANIAVEMPEAPHGGTLYRTLFLAALLLFILTFVLNTVAELVRQRLRRRYAEL